MTETQKSTQLLCCNRLSQSKIDKRCDYGNEQQRIESNKNFSKMEKFLQIMCKGKMTKSKLLSFAKLITSLNNNAKKVDRIAKRRKKSLICWFCENFDEVLKETIDESNDEEEFRLFYQLPLNEQSEDDFPDMEWVFLTDLQMGSCDFDFENV